MNQSTQDIDATAGAEQTNEKELICLNQTLLESVVNGDWLTYSNHCSVDLTCFEAETNGVLAEGLAFHRFYFDLPAAAASEPPTPIQVSMARPHIRWISPDAAVLTYTRLTQKMIDGAAVTASCCETRVWQRIDGTWKHVHVHRS
jgi:calcium/calmodulin-dependent protein kinase (CaM kinase) II